MPERFGYAYLLELRLILRQWVYWVLMVGIALFMLATNNNNPVRTWENTILSAYSWVAMGLLGMMMFAVFVAARPSRSRMDMIEATLPVGAEVSFARLAALLTCQIPLILMPVTLPLFGGALAGEPFPSMWTYVLEAVITVTFSILLTWWICTAMTVRRVTFVLVAFIWLGGFILSSMLNGPAVAHLTSVLRFMRHLFYSDLWGRMVYDNLPALFNVFYVGMIVLLAGLTVWLIHRRRFYVVSPVVKGILGVGVVITLAGYVSYAAEFHRMVPENGAPSSYSYSSPSTLADFVHIDYAVTRYDVKLDASDARRFDVSMDVVNRSGEARDALDFSLMAEALVSEVSVPFTHEGGILTLRFTPPLAAGEMRTVQLAYSMNNDNYFYMYGSTPRAGSFIREGGIYLPRNVSWYPRIGTTTEVMYEPRKEVFTEPAPFRLAVTGHPLPVFSNLPPTADGVFQSEGTTWAMLIAAPDYGRWSLVDGIELMAHKNTYQRVQTDLTEHLTDVRDVLAQYFPRGNLVVLNEFVYISLMDVSPGDVHYMDDYAAISSSFAPFPLTYDYWVYQYVIYPAVQQYLGARLPTSLTENVGKFVLLQIEHDGDAAAMREAVPPPPEVIFESEPPPGYVYPDSLLAIPRLAAYYLVTEALVEVYEQYGTAGVQAVLAAIRAEARTLENQYSSEIVAWIAAWTAENLAGGG